MIGYSSLNPNSRLIVDNFPWDASKAGILTDSKGKKKTGNDLLIECSSCQIVAYSWLWYSSFLCLHTN